jgi:hypothetical protein
MPLIRVAVLTSSTLLMAGWCYYIATRPQVVWVGEDGTRIEVGRDGRSYRVSPNGEKFFFSSSKTGKIFSPPTPDNGPATEGEPTPDADAPPDSSK